MKRYNTTYSVPGLPTDHTGPVNINLSYPVVVLNHAVFVHKLIPEVIKTGKGLEKYQIYSAYAASRGLHSLIRAGIYPQYRKNYLEETDKMLKKFDPQALANKGERYDFVKNVYDFLDFVGDNFGNAGILPPIEEDTNLTLQEQKDVRENEKALDLAIKLIQLHGKKILTLIHKDATTAQIKDAMRTEKEREFHQLAGKKFEEVKQIQEVKEAPKW